MTGVPKTRPAFVISFDCEGHWGMMDHLAEHGRLTTAGLVAAYERLLALLDRHQVKATFAFVGAFAMSEDEARANLPLFTEVGPRAQRWMAPFMGDLQSRRTDGWFAPAAAAAVKRSGSHELGSHGFSHLPLVEGEIGLQDFDRELASLRKTTAFAGEKELTLVYPR
ncbi:MAG: polysaccharide deacetylase family protein, partial [Elusimicrobiota bacterium]